MTDVFAERGARDVRHLENSNSKTRCQEIGYSSLRSYQTHPGRPNLVQLNRRPVWTAQVLMAHAWYTFKLMPLDTTVESGLFHTSMAWYLQHSKKSHHSGLKKGTIFTTAWSHVNISKIPLIPLPTCVHYTLFWTASEGYVSPCIIHRRRPVR